jgi:hypothetical protein
MKITLRQKLAVIVEFYHMGPSFFEFLKDSWQVIDDDDYAMQWHNSLFFPSVSEELLWEEYNR